MDATVAAGDDDGATDDDSDDLHAINLWGYLKARQVVVEGRVMPLQ